MNTYKKLTLVAMILCAFFLLTAEDSCDATTPAPKTASGIHEAVATQVKTGADGLTVEQRNINARLLEDNKPGAVKHLYVISPYSGQVILYSTVKGKVTSGGKRLTPTMLGGGQGYDDHFTMRIAGDSHYTKEVLQDDGTYGTSGEYLFWWDVQGRYHQHYLTGGQIVHISSEPLAVKSVIINVEATK